MGKGYVLSELEEMTKAVRKFCEDRDWDQFHTPKELAIGLVTEASELLDIFRFQTDEQVQTLLQKTRSREKIEDEVADVLFFLLRFAQKNNVELPQVLLKKLEKNHQKYPIEKAKASNKKYTEL